MAKDLENFDFPGFAHQKMDAESPVYPSLMAMMKVDIAISPESDVWIIHNQPLPEPLKWIEYDLDLESLTLVSLSGKIQDSGMKVPASIKKFLRRAKEVSVVYQGDEYVKDMCIVPLLVREGWN